MSKLPSTTRLCPVLCTWVLKLHCGLSPIFLHFWNPHDIYFHVQALISNHAHKRMGDQGVFPNRSDWVQFYTVRCFCLITLLKHVITLIYLWGGLYTSQSYPLWPENTIILTFDKLNPCSKNRPELLLNPVQHHPVLLMLQPNPTTCNADWHTCQGLALISRPSQDNLLPWNAKPMKNKQPPFDHLHLIG